MPTGIEQNKALVRRFFAGVESGDLSVFDEIIAEDYDDHLAGQSRGREVLKQYFTGLRVAFPDLSLPISVMVAEGDHVAVMNAVRGTHHGNFSGLAATGKRVDAMAFQLYRIQNGQLVEHWEIPDYATMMRQLQA